MPSKRPRKTGKAAVAAPRAKLIKQSTIVKQVGPKSAKPADIPVVLSATGGVYN